MELIKNSQFPKLFFLVFCFVSIIWSIKFWYIGKLFSFVRKILNRVCLSWKIQSMKSYFVKKKLLKICLCFSFSLFYWIFVVFFFHLVCRSAHFRCNKVKPLRNWFCRYNRKKVTKNPKQPKRILQKLLKNNFIEPKTENDTSVNQRYNQIFPSRH